MRSYSYIVSLSLLGSCTAAVKAAKKKEDPIQVFITAAAKVEIFDPVAFGGFVQAKDARAVGSEVNGTIETMKVRLGDQVSRGQVLYQVLPQGLGLDFKLHSVVSPIAGIISEIKFPKGTILKAGESAVTVADGSALEVDIQVAYDDLFQFKKGDLLEVLVAGGTTNENTLQAQVEAISPAADSSTGTYPVTLVLNCKSIKKHTCADSYKLGAFVRVLMKKNLRMGIKLPINVLHSDRRKVLVLNEKKRAQWVDVKLGAYYGKDVEVLTGIDEGMQVVTSFSRRPKDGDKVVIMSREEQKKLIFSKGDEHEKPGKSH